jgi:hypothetical protein
VGNSGVVRAMVAATSGKRKAWPLTDHVERLLEETYSIHAYPVKHKLWDCGLMKNFMASGSLARGLEVDEGDTMPFFGEGMIMTIYDGFPSLGMRRVPNLSIGTPTRYSWGCRDART